TIAFLARPGRNAFGRNIRAFTISANGGEAVCLTSALDRSFGAVHMRPVWAPDGGSLIVAAEDHGDIGLWRAAARSGVGAVPSAEPRRRMVGGGAVLNGCSLSADGRQRTSAASAVAAPAEVFVCGTDGSGERQLTGLNRVWKEATALASPERFQLTRAGLEIDVWVMRPAGFDPGRRYPALLTIHGGPHASYGNGFFDEFQVYAGAGYAVIYANPRGSQGYGEAFAQAVVGDWGGGDYADVMAVVDEALKRFPFIDA